MNSYRWTMLTSSLHRRLVVTSCVWIALTLAVTTGLLIYLSKNYVERRFDAELFDHLEEIVAAAERQPGGSVRLTWVPSDVRFRRHGSGWYWQISKSGDVLARSHSLSDEFLRLPSGTDGDRHSAFVFTGPASQRLRAMTDTILTKQSGQSIDVLVTGPASAIDHDVAEFSKRIAVLLVALGLGLVLVLVLQVTYGLRPLRALHHALVDIREGRRDRMAGRWPREIQHVVEDMNKLLDHNAALIERARAQASNLAHALKNPLTVIRNEAAQLEEPSAQLIGAQAESMRTAINRYSSQARTAGTTSLLATPVPVASILEDLLITLRHLYQERDLTMHVKDCDACVFLGEQQDREVMLGNLLDNACKWAASTVKVRCNCQQDRLTISVEDDGAGIPEVLLGEATERGARLDEATPGSGLGLSIVREIAVLYHGSLALSLSAEGGLRAQLDLPRARQDRWTSPSSPGDEPTSDSRGR